MHGPTLAIVLCLALPHAFADEPAALRQAPQAQGLMHASLVVPAPAAQAHANGQPLMKANLSASGAAKAAEADKPQEQEGRSVMAMLLAALALMTGIALRRWGTGAQ